MNLSYSQINLINHQNMIVLAPACESNALNFPHRKRFPKETAIAWLLKKNKRKLEWVQNIRWKLRWLLMFKVKTHEGGIRMLDCSWKLSGACLCAPGFLCIYFSLQWNILYLHPQVFRGSLFFHSAKIFAFREGVMIGLGALPLTPLESLAYMYWGKALRLLGGR